MPPESVEPVPQFDIRTLLAVTAIAAVVCVVLSFGLVSPRLVLPPLVLTIAICVAKRTFSTTSMRVLLGVVVAWVVSIFAASLTFALSSGLSEPYGSALIGLSAGATGALFVAITYILTFHKTASNWSLWMTVAVGAVVGGIGFPLEIDLNDHGYPFVARFVLHVMWQPCVLLSLLAGERLDNKLW